MTVGDLVRELLRLPLNAEIAVNGARALPAEPEIVKVCEFAFPATDRRHGGFLNPSNAFLLRPAREVI